MVKLIEFNKVNLLQSKLVIKFTDSEYFVKERLVIAFKSIFKTIFQKKIILSEGWTF